MRASRTLNAMCLKAVSTSLALAACLLVGCGDESVTAQDGGPGAATGSAGASVGLGEWIDAGDGIKVAILGVKVADETGGMMLKDDDRAVAIEYVLVNTGDSEALAGRKPLKLLAGGEQFGDGMRSAAAGAKFEGLPFARMVDRLPAGHVIRGWKTFAAPIEQDAELAVLVGRNGNPVSDLQEGDIAASVALRNGDAAEAPSIEVEPSAPLAVGDTIEGGAVNWTFHGIREAETSSELPEGRVAYTIEMSVVNNTDAEIDAGNATLDSFIYLTDGKGNASTADAISFMLEDYQEPEGSSMFAGWKEKLAPGEESRGLMLVTISADHGDLVLVASTAQGYKMSNFQAVAASPIGVFKTK